MTPLFHTHRLLTLLATLLVWVCLMSHAAAQEPESPTARAYQAAKALYDNGKFAEALAALQTFEGQYRFSMVIPRAIYLQGWCWAELQKYHEAISTFDRLRKGYPSASMIPDAILKQAECYRELKNYPTALELYRVFEAKYPNHEMLPRALLGEAWTLVKQGDLATAQEIVQKVRTQFADDPAAALDAQFLIAQILTTGKQYDAAVHVYEQIPLDTNDGRASEGFFLAGEALFEAGRWSDAIACYRRVQARTNLIETLRRQINDLQSQRANYAQRGALPTYARHLSDLRQLLARCEAGPDLGALVLFRIANCYQSLGRSEEASAAYHEFLALHPKDKLAEQAQVGFVRELIKRHQFDEAEGAAKEFQTRYPNSAFAGEVLLLQAEALFASGKIPQALDRFQTLAASNPQLPILETADFRIGDSYYTLHDFDHARDSFLAFVQQHPNSRVTPDALFRLGRCYFEISQKGSDPTTARANLADAIKSYEQLRATYPSDILIPEVTFQLGYLNACLASQEGDSTGQSAATTHFEKAIASFQEFVTHWPENPLVAEALDQLARNQYALGRFDKAIGSYRKLVEGFPDSAFAPLAAYEIAHCYGVENKREDMVAQFRAFVARYPTHPRVGGALYAIASQLERDRKTSEALAAYRDITARAVTTPHVTADLRKAAIASEMRIAAILEARGDVAHVVANCEETLRRFHEDPLAVNAMIGQIAEAYKSARRFNDAYACLDHLAAEYPQNDNVRIATVTSTIDLALGQYDNARAYAAALKLLADPEKDRLPSASYVSIGNALLQHDRFAEARDAYQKSLTMYPNDSGTAPLAQLGLGEAALGLYQLAEAEGIFHQVILKFPESSVRERAELGLARAYRAHAPGDPQDPYNVKAVELLNKIMVGADGDNAGEAAYLLGNCYFSFGGDERENKKAALAYYLRASLLMTGPHGEEAAFRSGQCDKALGNTQIARRAFEAYLRRFPNGLFVADAKRELESLPAQPQQS